jgi:hypothetical protein
MIHQRKELQELLPEEEVSSRRIFGLTHLECRQYFRTVRKWLS